MFRTTIAAALLLIPATAGAQAHGHGHRSHADTIPLYDNLGNLHHEVTTGNPEAQAYYDQGLRLLYAFNHAESVRSFAEGERRDSSCAMCAWGIALALGPNINAGMDSASGARAYSAVQRALRKANRVSARERAFIEALAERYSRNPVAERAPLDSAYAAAMRGVADRFPTDDEAQVLYADALMNLSPWNYWKPDGSPRPGTSEFIGRLRLVIDRNPDHPGACHLFIHAEEAHDPREAVDCAERLAELMPGAGHIVHMPGHIYIRVGRYWDAVNQNRHAVHADENYLEGPSSLQRGVYAQGYYPHNYHFMSFAASMAGNYETAIYAARATIDRLDMDIAKGVQWLEAITPLTYWTLVNFGKWDAILEEPLPRSDLRFTTGNAWYARGVAYAAKGRWQEAASALDSVTTIAAALPEGENKLALLVAGEALRGEIDLRRGDAEAAVDHFESARDLEDRLAYLEPPTWYYPVRWSLGKALLQAGRPVEAEQAYRESLERFPDTGWALYGLHQALDAQGRVDEAARALERFEEAWQHADIELEASRF